MKKTLFVVLFAVTAASLLFAQQKGRVVVQQFDNGRTVSAADARIVTNLIRSRIGASGAVTLVTRDDFDKILTEHSPELTESAWFL
jgi:hypothetical protein